MRVCWSFFLTRVKYFRTTTTKHLTKPSWCTHIEDVSHFSDYFFRKCWHFLLKKINKNRTNNICQTVIFVGFLANIFKYKTLINKARTQSHDTGIWISLAFLKLFVQKYFVTLVRKNWWETLCLVMSWSYFIFPR